MSTNSRQKSKSPDVSFVIPCYNSQDTIASTIESINAQSGDLTTEILVVDSSNHAEVRSQVEKFPHVRYIHNPVRLYPGQARNLGARIVEGEFLAFVDSDVTLQENWLVRLYSRMLNTESIKGAGAVILNANPNRLWSSILYWMEFSEFLPGSSSGFRSFLSSSNLFIRRKVFLDSPGFDLYFAMSEDMLLSDFFKGRLYLDDTTSACHRHRSRRKEVLRHLNRLGFWAGRMRASGIGRGGFLVKMRWLCAALPFYRTGIVLKRVIRTNPGRAIWVILLSPVLFWASCRWAAGFYQGLEKK